MKPHKHAELIKAWADGAEIEMDTCDGWIHLECPGWSENCEYRIKPEPKPDPVKYKAFIYNNVNRCISWVDARDPDEFNMGKDWMYMGSIEVLK